MNNIPTAKEFLKSKGYSDEEVYNNFGENQGFEISWFMIEFAKLHVQVALKEALESIPCLGSSTDIATYEEIEYAVLNAYPLENIK